MSPEHATHQRRARPGDWLQVHGLPGLRPKGGQILEVLGPTGHERFRVRWDDEHESIFYPSEAVHLYEVRPAGRRR